MKKIILAVLLIAAVTTVEGDGPDSINGQHNALKVSNPSSLIEDELNEWVMKMQLAPLKTHKTRGDLDFLLRKKKDSAELQCQREFRGFCIKSGDRCLNPIQIIIDRYNDHCCCCPGNTTSTTTSSTSTSTTSSTSTSTTSSTSTSTTSTTTTTTTDPCLQMDGYCVEDGGHCDGIIREVIDQPECCCCTGYELPWEYIGDDAFVPFKDDSYQMNWYKAQALCRSKGLNLYHPQNILAVAGYLHKNTNVNYYWLGAQGDSENQVWFDGTGLSIDDHWYRPSAFYNNGTNDCLAMIIHSRISRTVLIAGTDSCTERTTFNPLCG